LIDITFVYVYVLFLYRIYFVFTVYMASTPVWNFLAAVIIRKGNLLFLWRCFLAFAFDTCS